MPTTTPLPITVRRRTAGDGTTGWEAVTVAPIVTTHTIGLRPTAADVVALVERMQAAGTLDPAADVIVVDR